MDPGPQWQLTSRDQHLLPHHRRACSLLARRCQARCCCCRTSSLLLLLRAFTFTPQEAAKGH